MLDLFLLLGFLLFLIYLPCKLLHFSYCLPLTIFIADPGELQPVQCVCVYRITHSLNNVIKKVPLSFLSIDTK